MIGVVKVVKFPARMFAPEFEKIVHDRARFSHEVVLTNRVLEQMNERDITRRQVISTLRKGGVLTVPKLDKRHGTYVARMGYTVSGRWRARSAQFDGMKFHGSRLSRRLCGWPFAIAVSVALR